MTRRAEIEQGERAPAASPAASSGPGPQQPGVRELPLAAFMAENPGIVAIGKSGG